MINLVHDIRYALRDRGLCCAMRGMVWRVVLHEQRRAAWWTIQAERAERRADRLRMVAMATAAGAIARA